MDLTAKRFDEAFKVLTEGKENTTFYVVPWLKKILERNQEIILAWRRVAHMPKRSTKTLTNRARARKKLRGRR